MTSSIDALRKPVSKSQDGGAWPFDAASWQGAYLETLNLVQWLARIANSYVESADAMERTTLEFRAKDIAFVTKPFCGDTALELRLPALKMQFIEDGKPVPHLFDPEERSPAKVEAWLLVELLHRGIGRSKFSKALPYEIPDLMSGDAVDHSPQQHEKGLDQLAAWFRNAAELLLAASGAGKVECLPQSLELRCAVKGSRKAVFGFSPGDERNAQPYFFIDSGHGRGNQILPVSMLAADPAAAVRGFLKTAAA